MNDALELLLYGFGLLIFGGGGVFLFLCAAERVCRWIDDLSNTNTPK
jgi:Na+-transporting methylmalonyl-CoA/oxaloacetate decarboxylase gamma subunit